MIVLNSGFREQVLSVCDTDPPTLLLSPGTPIDIHVMHDRTKGRVRWEKVSTCTVPPGERCRPALEVLQGKSVDLHCISRGKVSTCTEGTPGEKCRPALKVLQGKSVDLHWRYSRGKVSTCTVPPGEKCRPALEVLQGKSVNLHWIGGKFESVPVSFDFP